MEEFPITNSRLHGTKDFLLSSSPDWGSKARFPENNNNKEIIKPRIIEKEFNLSNQNNPSNFDLDNFFPEINIQNFSNTLFIKLFDPNEETREAYLTEIIKLFNSCLDFCASSQESAFLSTHLTMITRLSTECPHKKIATEFSKLYEQIKEKDLGVTIPTPAVSFSVFIPNSEGFGSGLDKNSETLAQLCEISFIHRERQSHLVQLLAIHPTYMERFLEIYDFIMVEPGPLPYSWRRYIAILASSRHKCHYLVENEEREFLDEGGELEWLQGIHCAPQKIQSLMELNEILAHQPWLLSRDHIASLAKGKVWSISELTQAIVIMSTFHSLSGLVLGCNITQEIGNYCPENDTDSGDDSLFTLEDSTTELVKALSGLTIASEDKEPLGSERIFEIAGNDIISPHLADSSLDNDLSKYIGTHNLEHVDFDTSSTQYTTFHYSDYTWKDQGYGLLSQFYSGAAPLLDDLFSHIYSLTYRTFSRNEGVNTEPFRVAIWNYVHRVLGILHDDYNYQHVNFWLNRSIKAYIKSVVCFPETITKKDFSKMGVDLTPKEKCHLTLLAIEARKQAELLYGLRSIMEYQVES